MTGGRTTLKEAKKQVMEAVSVWGSDLEL